MTSTLTSQLVKRNPDDFPEKLKFALDQITINEVPRVVGSSAYKVHQYPSDVDVFEQVTYNNGGSKEVAQIFYADQFQNIAERLLIQRRWFHFADFKAGLDERFKLDLPDDLTQEKAQEMVTTLGNLHHLPEQLRAELFHLASTCNFEGLKEKFRELRTVRWTLEEMIKGSKTLVGGVCMTLADAIGMNSVVKLDTIVWFSGRFQPVEVFYNLQYQDHHGHVKEFNPLNNYVEGLTEDIEKYSSKQNYNPLKVLKRMWSLSRTIQCGHLLEEISPILSSNAAALNQITSDIETLEILLDMTISPKQLCHVFVESLTFHKRATNHLSAGQLAEYHQLIDPIFDLYIDWAAGENVDCIKSKLKQRLIMSRDYLKGVVVDLSANFLDRLNNMNISCGNPQFMPSAELEVKSPYSSV